MDLRISLAWDTDDVDIDLHVIDPANEECYYSHRLSQQGGLVSRDFTKGYGPEEFMLREANPGKYKVYAKYYSNHQKKFDSGGTTVTMSLFTNYARPNQERQTVTLRLKSGGRSKDKVLVGEIDWTPGKKEFGATGKVSAVMG